MAKKEKCTKARLKLNDRDERLEHLSKEERNRVDKIIRAIQKKFPGKVQMFDCVGFEPDAKEVICADKQTTVYYAVDWNYIEILGLSDLEYSIVFDTCGLFII